MADACKKKVVAPYIFIPKERTRQMSCPFLKSAHGNGMRLNA